jgi:hypothetical protein
MRRATRLADINEVYVHTEAAYKEQLAIRLRHMEERFGSLIRQKKEHARIQHEVPTDHLANMDIWSECSLSSTKTTVCGAKRQIYR